MTTPISLPHLVASLEAKSRRNELHTEILDALGSPRPRPMAPDELAAFVGARSVRVALELVRLERAGLVVHGNEDGVERYALSLRGKRLLSATSRTREGAE
jgi:hypothetical protein